MNEAFEPIYFVDGYFIKNFNIWPEGVDKNNLLPEQKVFVTYLMGSLPGEDDWTMQVDYMKEKSDINNLAEKDIEITAEEIDVAKLQGRDINELRKERLQGEKERQLAELNKKFGVKERIEQARPDGLPEIPKTPEEREQLRQNRLWELLQGKGIIKEKNDG